MSIQVRNLHKYFDGKEVLKGIDFTFDDAKVNMVIGASGSGKTVLVKCLVGLLKPNSGTIFYNDDDFLKKTYKERRKLRQQIGMLFQSAALFDSLTVAENVGFPLRMFTKMPNQAIKERVKVCLEQVNLPGIEKLLPSELSGGMKKRVGIARAIVMNPRYLFFDEPNSGLDPQTATVIDHLIVELTRQYKTPTIVVSHDIRSVLEIGDKILFIHEGNKEWEGSKETILNEKNPVLYDFIQKSGFGTN